MTFTLDFQGQILKKSYLRNGMADWHGTKGMWVDRMLHLLCDFQCPPHPWPWPWIFKVKFWKCCISGMEWPIDMERKRCESIGCYTHFVTFNIPLTHDLDLGRAANRPGISGTWYGKGRKITQYGWHLKYYGNHKFCWNIFMNANFTHTPHFFIRISPQTHV